MTGTSARDAAVATRHVTIARCRYGPMMWLNSDRVIGECLRLYGEFAEGEVRLLLSLLKPGDVVLDAGAHIGTLAVPLALAVGAQGRVIAFEPQRMSYACLCANLTMNGLHWAEARRGALGARARRMRVARPQPDAQGNWGGAPLVEAADGDEIELSTVDALALARLALLKIDVEGMEAEVLKGASRTRKRLRPAVYLEAKRGAATRASFARLRAAGYDLYWHFAHFFRKDNWRRNAANRFPDTGDINALALAHEKKLAVKLPPVEGESDDWDKAYASFAGRK